MLEQEAPILGSEEFVEDIAGFPDCPNLPEPRFNDDAENYTNERHLELEALADTTGAGDRGYIDFEPIVKPDHELSAPEPLTNDLQPSESLLGLPEVVPEPLRQIEAQDISPLEAELSLDLLEPLEPLGEPIEGKQEAVEGYEF
jgi:hypothetical protein